jgi:hypothetical protein
VFEHGDGAGVDSQRRNQPDWLHWMGLNGAGQQGVLDRYVGYYESYAESHDTLDRDRAVQEEVRNSARAVAEAVRQIRAGKLVPPDAKLRKPRPK